MMEGNCSKKGEWIAHCVCRHPENGVDFPVGACAGVYLQMSAVMAFASASLETDRRTGVEIATAGNASADRTIVETATVSDAEKLTKPRRKLQRNRNGV